MRGCPAIEAAFAGKRCALIGYLMAGYPDERRFLDCARAALDAGVDMLEVGVPFSDPIADGKVIQAASDAALRNGVTLRKVLAMVTELRRTHAQPILLMSYLNPVRAYGIEAFLKSAHEAGVDGAILPDLIPDEAAALRSACGKAAFALVNLAAPNATDERLARVLKETTGFLYALGLEGVTGERDTLSPALDGFLKRLHAARSAVTPATKIAVGFGLSRPEHVALLAGRVDGVIVGSALVRRAAESAQSVASFVAGLRSAA